MEWSALKGAPKKWFFYGPDLDEIDCAIAVAAQVYKMSQAGSTLSALSQILGS